MNQAGASCNAEETAMRGIVHKGLVAGTRKCSGLIKPLLWAYYRLMLVGRRRPPRFSPVAKRLCDMLDYRIPLRRRLPNGDRVIVPCNDVVGVEIACTGWYESETVNVVSQVLRPGMTAIDVGAHIGQYTLVMSGLVGTAGEVHSFEPSPTTFRWLEQNVLLSGRSNIRLNCCALADHSGPQRYYHAPPKNPGAGSLVDRADASYERTSMVPCRTLDDYVAETGVPNIDVVKIDVEGAEWRVLQGARHTISRWGPTLVVEFSVRLLANSHRLTDLSDWLQGEGYLLFAVGPTPLSPYRGDGGRFVNVLAVRSTRMSNLPEGLVKPI